MAMKPPAALYLALDVGGTKTSAVLADETQVLARASAGSIKTLRVAPGAAAGQLGTILDELEKQAGVRLRRPTSGAHAEPGADLGPVKRTCVGTSGIAAPGVRTWLRNAFAEAIGGELLLLGDEVIALDAAFRGERGVLAIAGTGSNVVGRARGGAMVHTGGWGPALADQGSGHWIGSEALRAAFRALDAAPPGLADAVSVRGEQPPVPAEALPPLLRAFVAAQGSGSLDDLIGLANAPGFHAAGLVPLVVSAARAGDSLAQGVLVQAGAELAALVSAVARKVHLLERAQLLEKAQLLEQTQGGLADATENPLEVAWTGGVLTHLPEVREAMEAALRAQRVTVHVRSEAVEPLDGALWHARGRP